MAAAQLVTMFASIITDFGQIVRKEVPDGQTFLEAIASRHLLGVTAGMRSCSQQLLGVSRDVGTIVDRIRHSHRSQAEKFSGQVNKLSPERHVRQAM